MNQTLHDLRYAIGALRRVPLVALTIVGTVGLGLGLVTMVFTLLNTMLFRVDAVRDPDSLVGVERPKKPGDAEHVPFTRPEYEAMRRDARVFTDVAAVLRGNRTRIDGRSLGCALVTGNFLQMLGVNMRLGRPLEPADDRAPDARSSSSVTPAGLDGSRRTLA